MTTGDAFTPEDSSIEALILAVTVEWPQGGDGAAEALRALAKNVWWAGFNAAKSHQYDRDAALGHAIEALSGQSPSALVQLRLARAFELYLAGELNDLPDATQDVPKAQVDTSEAAALLKRLGL